jgi:hypothetical protein
MLVANRMAPPRYPARAVAAVIPAAARTAEVSAAHRLTPSTTHRPPGRFTPDSEHQWGEEITATADRP